MRPWMDIRFFFLFSLYLLFWGCFLFVYGSPLRFARAGSGWPSSFYWFVVFQLFILGCADGFVFCCFIYSFAETPLRLPRELSSIVGLIVFTRQYLLFLLLVNAAMCIYLYSAQRGGGYSLRGPFCKRGKAKRGGAPRLCGLRACCACALHALFF